MQLICKTKAYFSDYVNEVKDTWQGCEIVYHIYPTPPLGQDMTQGQFLSGVLTGLNSEFSFS